MPSIIWVGLNKLVELLNMTKPDFFQERRNSLADGLWTWTPNPNLHVHPSNSYFNCLHKSMWVSSINLPLSPPSLILPSQQNGRHKTHTYTEHTHTAHIHIYHSQTHTHHNTYTTTQTYTHYTHIYCHHTHTHTFSF